MWGKNEYFGFSIHQHSWKEQLSLFHTRWRSSSTLKLLAKRKKNTVNHSKVEPHGGSSWGISQAHVIEESGTRNIYKLFLPSRQNERPMFKDTKKRVRAWLILWRTIQTELCPFNSYKTFTKSMRIWKSLCWNWIHCCSLLMQKQSEFLFTKNKTAYWQHNKESGLLCTQGWRKHVCLTLSSNWPLFKMIICFFFFKSLVNKVFPKRHNKDSH